MEEEDLYTLRASKFTLGFFPRGVAYKLTKAIFISYNFCAELLCAPLFPSP
jgi:hypothetical protein